MGIKLNCLNYATHFGGPMVVKVVKTFIAEHSGYIYELALGDDYKRRELISTLYYNALLGFVGSIYDNKTNFEKNLERYLYATLRGAAYGHKSGAIPLDDLDIINNENGNKRNGTRDTTITMKSTTDDIGVAIDNSTEFDELFSNIYNYATENPDFLIQIASIDVSSLEFNEQIENYTQFITFVLQNIDVFYIFAGALWDDTLSQEERKVYNTLSLATEFKSEYRRMCVLYGTATVFRLTLLLYVLYNDKIGEFTLGTQPIGFDDSVFKGLQKDKYLSFINQKQYLNGFFYNRDTNLEVTDADTEPCFYLGTLSLRHRILKCPYFEYWDLLCDYISQKDSNAYILYLGNNYVVNTFVGRFAGINPDLYELYDILRYEIIYNFLLYTKGKLLTVGSECVYLLVDLGAHSEYTYKDVENRNTLKLYLQEGSEFEVTFEDITDLVQGG